MTWHLQQVRIHCIKTHRCQNAKSMKKKVLLSCLLLPYGCLNCTVTFDEVLMEESSRYQLNEKFELADDLELCIMIYRF